MSDYIDFMLKATGCILVTGVPAIVICLLVASILSLWEMMRDKE